MTKILYPSFYHGQGMDTWLTSPWTLNDEPGIKLFWESSGLSQEQKHMSQITPTMCSSLQLLFPSFQILLTLQDLFSSFPLFLCTLIFSRPSPFPFPFLPLPVSPHSPPLTNGCCILSNTFSASIEMIMWFLSFVF